jgi:hypothetical protein
MRLSLTLIFTCTLGVANTLTNPSFGQPETNCNYTTTAPYTTATCPVIGNPIDFDIQSISVSVVGSTVTATIDFNYGGSSSLAPYQDGSIQLQPGDLLFYDPSDPNQIQFGVAIDSTRPGSQYNFISGDLYQIGGNISLESAETALGNPDAYYRRSEQVLMVDNTGTPAVAGTGDGVNVVSLGNGKTAAEYAVTVQFNAPSSFLALIQNGELGVAFSSADCGNAVLTGNVGVPTPEPEGAALMGLGIGMIGAAGYWRKRSSRGAKRN